MMIELDGATGEGGGQILLSSLTLAMITGQAFRIKNIRANRSEPGLMRQHLVAVQAAAHISGALVTHAQVGSTELTFAPQRIVAGEIISLRLGRLEAAPWFCKPCCWRCYMRTDPRRCA